MKLFAPSPVLASAIIATQLLGPATLWAAEQRGIRLESSRGIVVSALTGDPLTVQGSSSAQPAQFQTVLNVGDRVTTGARTTAELLISERTVITLNPGTTAQIITVSPEQITIQVTAGTVRVAAAASALGPQGRVTVQTPTSQVQTRGGIVRVAVDVPAGSADQAPGGEARPYRASYTPDQLVAAVNSRGELITVDEGTAEIPGAGPAGGTLTVKSGQSVTVQAGRAGAIASIANSVGPTAGIVANPTHRNTPKEGVANLVALQVGQATALGKALTGTAKTEGGESEKKSDTKNVINGASAGVGLAAAFANAFGSGNAYSGTGGNNVNKSGSATVDDNSDAPALLGVASGVSTPVKGGAGLLLFTDRHPKALVGTNGSFSLQDSLPVKSKFQAGTELLFVDGGDKKNAPHGGAAPISTLIARGVTVSNASLSLTYSSNKNGGCGSDTGLCDLLDELGVANATVVISQPETDDRPVFDNSSSYVYDSALDKSAFPSDSNSELSKDPAPLPDAALNDFSSEPNGYACQYCSGGTGSIEQSFIDGAIRARSEGALVTLSGGVVLDKDTTVSLGATNATNDYFENKPGLNNQDAKFNGSLLAVMASQDGGFKPAFVKIQDRVLGVLDGSSITETAGNKTALLSVLDSRLIGPEATDPSTGGPTSTSGRADGEIAPLLEFDGAGQTDRDTTSATVTSALVVRSTDVVLDGALLSASSPLLAMMNATMTTKAHFADLAGNAGRPALVATLLPGDALVRLNNAVLTIQNGNLLNLNNATAAVTGYLFSLSNGSTLQINNGSLFSLNNSSSLTLTGNAFGVFGGSGNTLTIENNLCGAGAACGSLVNSAGTPFLLPDGVTQLKVAGVTQNVVLPDGFKPFALGPGATVSNTKIDIDANDALFHMDSGSTLTIVPSGQ